MNLIMLGPQGSGKGTQAQLLVAKMGYFYFESGGFLRELATKDERIRGILDKGVLVPDEEVASFVFKYLDKQVPNGQNIVFDGYPRSLNQYRLLKDWLVRKGSKIDRVILLEISTKETIRRLSARRMDKKTGDIYNLITNPPPKNVPPINLVQREDDKPQAIRERLKSYQKKTIPMVEEIEKEGILERVDGERPIEVISKDIISRLSKGGGK